MTSTNPINSLFAPGGAFGSFSSPFGGLSPLSFGNVFDQAMSQSNSPAQSAKIAYLRTQYMRQTILYGMFSDPKTSTLGYGGGDLFGMGGPYGLPSWAYDAQRLLGADSNAGDLINLSQQAALLAQSRLMGGLGSTGGSFDSMF
jgi:hypothetical protein